MAMLSNSSFLEGKSEVVSLYSLYRVTCRFTNTFYLSVILLAHDRRIAWKRRKHLNFDRNSESAGASFALSEK